jgi:hypothetical protein
MYFEQFWHFEHLASKLEKNANKTFYKNMIGQKLKFSFINVP